MSFSINKVHWLSMVGEVTRRAPAEGCGIVAGKDFHASQVFPLPNIADSPDRFYIDPQRQLQILESLEDYSLDMVAIFHSHPRGPEIPSFADIEQFYYPGVISIILFPKDGNWAARAYLIHEGSYSEITLVVEDSE